MNTQYDEIELRDLVERYNKSLGRYTSCYDVICQLAGNVDKPALIDLAEALARHSAAIARDELTLEQLGISKTDMQKFILSVANSGI